jgi:transposase-like protein
MSDITCPRCNQRDQIIKSGRNRSGSHRYRCQSCRHYFTPKPKLKDSEQLSRKQEAVTLYMQGNSLRQVGRILGVHHQTVEWWVTSCEDPFNPLGPSNFTPYRMKDRLDLMRFLHSLNSEAKNNE